MNHDLELELWQSLWQTGVTLPPDLLEKAKKQLRRARIMLIADVWVTIVIGGLVMLWSAKSRQPSVRFLATWVWLMLIAAWVFRWFNNRDNWTGTAPNTEVFLERLRQSYRASLRNVKFAWVLGGIQLVFNSLWVYRELNAHAPMTFWQFLSLKLNLVVWTCAALVFAWTVWFFRKVKNELIYVHHLQNDWEPLSHARLECKPNHPHWLIEPLNAISSRLQEALDGELRRKKKGWRI